MDLNTNLDSQKLIDQTFLEAVQKQYDYFSDIKKTRKKYCIDYKPYVEGPILNTLEEKLAHLLEDKDIIEIIRACLPQPDRGLLAKTLIERLLVLYADKPKQYQLERILKIILGVYTEGVVTAPLDGLCNAWIDPKENFPILNFAGPIRAAGATILGVIVTITIYLSKKLGLDEYKPTAEQIERTVSECMLYSKIHPTQLRPSEKELRQIIGNCPVMIDGEQTEVEECLIHKMLPRIKKPRVRGGVALVIIEGLMVRSTKVIKVSSPLNLDLKWLEQVKIIGATVRTEGSRDTNTKESRYPLSMGRPIISVNDSSRGFKLRIGTSGSTTLCGINFHPKALDLFGFINIGTQIIVDKPGKGATVSGVCEDLNPPIVKYIDGVREYEWGSREKVLQIVDSGQVLIALGDFLEFNKNLPKRDYCNGLFRRQTNYQIDPLELTEDQIFEVAPKIPSRSGLYLNNLSLQEFLKLNALYEKGVKTDDYLHLLDKLVVRYQIEGDRVVIKEKKVLEYYLSCLRHLDDRTKYYDYYYSQEQSKIKSSFLIEYINEKLAETGQTLLCEKGYCCLFIRIGRPQSIGITKIKSKFKKNKSAVHSLLEYVPSKSSIEVFWKSVLKQKYGYNKHYIFYCEKCSLEQNISICRTCGTALNQHIYCMSCKEYFEDGLSMRSKHEKHKLRLYHPYKTDFESLLNEIKFLEAASGFKIADRSKKFTLICSTNKIRYPESILKGLLRSKHDLYTSKDGTFRITGPNLPCTHFRPKDVLTNISFLRSIGYTKDSNCCDLQKDDQTIFLNETDIIVPLEAAHMLFRGTKFIDELLRAGYAQKEDYYGFTKYQDLLGTLVYSLSPHTSAAVIHRIVGFTKSRAFYNNPVSICGRRRDADGDMDAHGLAADGFLNSSLAYTKEGIGPLMSVPITYTTVNYLDNISKEVHNLQVDRRFYEEIDITNLKQHKSDDLKKVNRIQNFIPKKRIKPTQWSYNTPRGSICYRNTKNLYTDSENNIEKIQHMENIARLTPYINHFDTYMGLIEGHITPDIRGNFNAYYRQRYKCSRCRAQYTICPLSQRCLSCYSGSLKQTVYKGMVVKYVPILKRLLKNIKQLKIDPRKYAILQQKVSFILDDIKSIDNQKNNAIAQHLTKLISE